VPDPVADEQIDNINAAAELGDLLRRLRGVKTQQNVADHAKRNHLYLHRPDLSTIERGRRLPTANELRAILHACGRDDLFDRLDDIRLRLQAGPAGESAAAEPSRPGSYRPARKLILATFTAAVVLIVAVGVMANRITNGPPFQVGNSLMSSPTPSPLDTQAAVEALRGVPLCAESLHPDSRVQTMPLAQNPGPTDAVEPNRLVELRATRDAKHGWIVWAHLAKSASERDRLWLDWSYLPEPTERYQWRQCGPHPISSGPDSPAILATDVAGRPRWFRACGQAPPEDRPPGSKRNSFCTSWVPVRP
jgi:hypothetical protein